MPKNKNRKKEDTIYDYEVIYLVAGRYAEELEKKLTATEAKLTKAKVFEKIVRDMYPKYMPIVDGAVEVSLKALDKQS